MAGKRFGNGHGFKDRTYWKEKWASMSDEEKTKFREEWRMRCGRPKERETKS
ncbi:MAG: hypothetical protein WDO19_29870 [Bacteroidota bacterium]